MSIAADPKLNAKVHSEPESIHNALYKVHMDLHCPEWDAQILAHVDMPGLIATVAKTGTKFLYFFAKDHYGNAYYNTAVGHKHKCIGTRDLLAEAIEEGRRKGINMVAYYSVIWDNHACADHPDWCLRNERGEEVKDTASAADAAKWHYVCHNSPGYLAYAKAQLREIAQYDIAGFHLDMINLDFGGLSCYCDQCRALFHHQTGKELPRTPTWDETWYEFLEFRYQSVERMAWALRRHIEKVRPGTHVVFNYHGSPGFDWRVGQRPVSHSKYSTMNTGETYTPMLGDMYPGMEVRYVRSLEPGKPFEMVPWRMNRATDFTIKPLIQLRWEAAVCLAGGGTIMLIDQPFHTGQPDPVAYDRLAQVFAEIEAKREYFGGEFQRHVALYYSVKSRDRYGRDRQDRYLLPVMGAYKALAESHFDIEFIFDESVSAERLAQFPVLYLPGTAVLSPAECTLIEEYVKNGGCLVASFDASLYGEDGQRLDNFRLAKVLGVDYAGTVDCDTHYWRALGEPYGAGVDPRQYVMQPGQVHLVRAAGASEVGDLHEAFFKKEYPERFYSHNIHPPYRRVGGALYVNQYGRGKAFYLPHAADAAYANLYEIPEQRQLLANIVRAAGHRPEVEVVKAPMNVELVVCRQPARTVVHLIQFSPNRQACTLPSLNRPIRPSIRMEEPMIYRAVIEVHTPFKSVRALHPSTRIEVEGPRLTITCEDVHDALIIER